MYIFVQSGLVAAYVARASNGASMLAGPIDFRHAFLDMTSVEVAEGPHTRAGRTCPAAMGFSFAAGTTDGQPPRIFLIKSVCITLQGCCCAPALEQHQRFFVAELICVTSVTAY